MKAMLMKFTGLCLVLATIAANAQDQPAPPPASITFKSNNLAIPTNSPLFLRSSNFGRLQRTNIAPYTAAPANPAANPGRTIAAPVNPLGTQGAGPGANAPGVPGGAVPNPLLSGALPAGPSITSTSANFAATNILGPKGATNDIGAKMMNFQEADLSQILEVYAELTGRTLIKSPQVPQNVKISMRNQTPLTRQEGIDALNTVLGLNQIAMVLEGEKFIKVVPQAAVPGQAVPFTTNSYDKLPESMTTVAQIVQLKYLLPEEATSIIQPFANLPNSIVAVKGSPVLVLRDFAENVKRMLEILEKVDVSVPSEIETVVIPIKYALAGEIAGVLSGLGATTGSGLTGGGGGGLGAGGFGGGGGFGSGTSGFGSGGTGLGTGSTGSRFGGTGVGGGAYGTGSGAGGYGARGFGGTGTGVGGSGGSPFGSGASRTGFGNRLNQAVAGAVGRAGGQGAGDIAVIGQYGPTKIIPDERSNALLVFADRRDLASISNIISKLDVVLPQVLIEALILEVNLGNSKSLGVSLRQNHQKLGDLDVAGGAVNGPGFLDPRNISSIAGFSTNIPNGFSYFGKLNDDFNFAVTAAANDNRINVLSRPRIQTSTAKPASIFVGETRPYVTGTYFSDFSGTGSRSQYSQLQIGINLNVVPIINQEGLVVMDIQQHISQVSPNGVKIDGNDVPVTIDRDANAYVAVHDRDTIILGGFISTTKSKSTDGVPFLKDIPGLGMLFRSSSDSIQRVELMVLIRPTVLPTPEAAALEAAAEADRNTEIKRARREEQDFQQKRLERLRREEEMLERKGK